MKPEEIRIAIAEACGWNDPHWECPRCGRVDPSNVTNSERHDECMNFVHWVERPDYPNDLNAMHKAVQCFTDQQCKNWDFQLFEIVKRDRRLAYLSSPIPFDQQNATSAQRAEAFLRTLGLWKEEE